MSENTRISLAQYASAHVWAVGVHVGVLTLSVVVAFFLWSTRSPTFGIVGFGAAIFGLIQAVVALISVGVYVLGRIAFDRPKAAIVGAVALNVLAGLVLRYVPL